MSEVFVECDLSLYILGEKFVKSAQEDLVIDNLTEGLRIIYYDSAGVLNEETNPANFGTIIKTNVVVAALYWSTVDNAQVYFTGNNEYHGITMSGATHSYLHTNFGTQFVSGGAIGDIVADESGDLEIHAQYS